MTIIVIVKVQYPHKLDMVLVNYYLVWNYSTRYFCVQLVHYTNSQGEYLVRIFSWLQRMETRKVKLDTWTLNGIVCNFTIILQVSSLLWTSPKYLEINGAFFIRRECNFLSAICSFASSSTRNLKSVDSNYLDTGDFFLARRNLSACLLCEVKLGFDLYDVACSSKNPCQNKCSTAKFSGVKSRAVCLPSPPLSNNVAIFLVVEV